MRQSSQSGNTFSYSRPVAYVISAPSAMHIPFALSSLIHVSVPVILGVDARTDAMKPCAR